ncbi:MAG: hypothetical protein A3D16_09855 [Rhodobacterales bacterium RIFCSPHIGHO2_02_FULL_62_130]|nr:MAG: hypothetical protein A3D16_09855 [Rhodobacterales bacterium RIFCSPHIGHO2_02_FULL_62_130]OHC56315.1 MAG: hypothetical protein A3E48_20780 [Rhodobacterales bacterium RIFCSPHIGHO2_12_FULL_62_75]
MSAGITHGHLWACACGTGKPDQGWFGYGAGRETHYVQCGCGEGVSDESEDGSTAKWNALQRSREADRVRAVLCEPYVKQGVTA